HPPSRPQCIIHRTYSACTWAREYSVLPPAGGPARQITAPPGLVFGNHVAWAPDSQRLVLQTWNGPQFQFQVWERATGRLRVVSPLGEGDKSYGFSDYPPFQWVSSEQLL